MGKSTQHGVLFCLWSLKLCQIGYCSYSKMTFGFEIAKWFYLPSFQEVDIRSETCFETWEIQGAAFFLKINRDKENKLFMMTIMDVGVADRRSALNKRGWQSALAFFLQYLFNKHFHASYTWQMQPKILNAYF